MKIININLSMKDKKNIKLQYTCDKNTKVEELFKYLYFYINNENPDEQQCLVWQFIFIINNEKKLAQPEYPLLNFLVNFNFDLSNINIYFFNGGFGAGFNFEKIANIRINNNEPLHLNTPHVHISKIQNKKECVRINLLTLTQFKNDKIKFDKMFKRKERKIIINFLEQNKEELIDFYDKYVKGEYIKTVYYFGYNGNDYSFQKDLYFD